MSSHARFRLLLHSINGQDELQALGEDVLDESEALKAQRDELLEVVRDLDKTLCDGEGCVLCAAIAKAEGER